jgi:hypothetical protein
MSKIHEKDLEQSKQVFEVTLPQSNLEKIQICVGNAYETTKGMVKYNIYNVDKNTKKVTECIGFYELAKETEVLDKEGDFNVRELGEKPLTIFEEFKARFSKTKSRKTLKESAKPKKSDELSPPQEPRYIVDDQHVIAEYFGNNFSLSDEDIVSTYFKHFKSPGVWVNDVGVSITGIFENVYIIVANEQREYSDSGVVKQSTKSTKPIDLDMVILPRNEELDYSKDRKYVLISYISQTHYRLIKSNGKVLFSESELPSKIITRFCSKHHSGEDLPEGVAEEDFPIEIITTSKGGDCFFDSVYRATKASDVDAPADAYLKEVHEFREEIAEKMDKNPLIQEMIKTLYRLNTTQDVDSISSKFYKDKFKRKPTKDDDAVFKYAYSSLFGVDKHDENAFSFQEKQEILVKYLTLLYEFFPSVSEKDQDTFKKEYNDLYGVGKSMDIKDTLENQRTALANVLQKPVPKPPPGPKPKFVVADEPEPAPKPKNTDESKDPEPKPAPKPAPKFKVADEPAPQPKNTDESKDSEPAPKPKVADTTVKTSKYDIPEGTESKLKAIIQEILDIYDSESSVEEREKQLSSEKYNNVKYLDETWKIIARSDKTIKNPVPKTKKNLLDCLSKNENNLCVSKRSKKATEGGSKKYTRKKI